ncbi:MAG: radical SAM protein [Planctomycetes bacterium]|nr:radical SAM protein [Planctomycetota bacterium]
MSVPREMAEVSAAEFHAFRIEGENYLLHIPTSAIFGTTDIGLEWFAARERGEEPAAAWARLVAAHGPQAVTGLAESAGRLLSFLREHASPPPMPEAKFLEQILHHHPRSLMLFVTSRCNLRCTYCYENQSLGTRRPPDMDCDLLRRIIDGFLERSGRRRSVKITFFGGEPLLAFPIVREAVEYGTARAEAMGKKMGFAITTNATLFDDEIISFLVRHEFGVMASIDGPAEIHDRHRVFPGGRGSHAIVSRNIRRLLDAQLAAGVLTVKLRATMTRNAADGDAINRYFLETFPGARIMIGESMGTAELMHEWDVPLGGEEETFEILERFESALERIPAEEAETHFRGIIEGLIILHGKTLCPPEVPGFPMLCGVGRNMLGVASDGALYPCHRFVGMPRFRIGDAVPGPDPERLRAFYEKVIGCYRAHCARCWARNLCQGDCPAYLAREDGSVGPPNARRCELLRRGFERKIRLYWRIEERRPDLFARWFVDGDSDFVT